MTKTPIIVALAAAALAITPSVAAAKTSTKPHCSATRVAKRETVKRRELVRVPERKHGHIVHKHHHIVYVRVKRHGKMVFKHVRRMERVHVWRCIKRGTTTTTAPISYVAHVDPTFTQNPSDPLAVTYAYSGDATESINGDTIDLGAEGELPDGVLNFYSATAQSGPVGLVCSMNVGGSVTGGSCFVGYSQTGQYTVTTQYIPNSASAVTQSDTVTVSASATTTLLQFSTAASNAYYTPVVSSGSTPIPFQSGDISFVIVDTTTGQTVGTLSSAVANDQGGVNFRIATGPDICDTADSASCVGPVDTSNSFSVQAIYGPTSGSPWAGSSSEVLSLDLS